MNNSKPMVCKSCGYDVFISGQNLELYLEQDVMIKFTYVVSVHHMKCNDTNRGLLMW